MDSEASVPEAAKDTGARLVNWALYLMIAIGLAAVSYALFSAASKPDATGLKRFKTGEMATLQFLPEPPPMPLDTFTGPTPDKTTLAQFKGKVVVLNLWATWCAPCVEEMPTLAALQTAFADQPVVVVALSVDPERGAIAAAERLKELSGGVLPFRHDFDYGVYYGAKGTGFPTTIIYDRNGLERARLAGSADWSSPEAKALITAILES
jgi:thiol-disulfide isomerase/thioredoxin